MDESIKKNIIYIMIYACGVLTGLSFVWRYPKAYSLLLFILGIGFILNLNNMILNKKDENRLIIKIK